MNGTLTAHRAASRISPGTLSLALSLALHSMALAAPALMALYNPSRDSAFPSGGQVLAIDWVELESPPAKPQTQKPIIKAQPVADVPVPAAQPAKTEAAPKPTPTRTTPSKSLVAGSPSGKALTLGRPEGLSQEALKYHDELYLLFESRKTYPMAARRLNQEGQVLISMRIWADGKIDDQRVIKPSPYQRLNDAALGMVRQIDHFKPLPKDSGPYAYFHLPVEYSLN